MQKKISIIIPVYNGHKYIGRCLDSVLAQVNFKPEDLDVILLNDGSTDESLRILKQYETLHPKTFRVIDQMNIGVANTRNKGIDMAQGEYIVFIDQDDWIEPDYCDIFYKEIHENNLDVVSGGYRRADGNGNTRYIIQPPNNTFGKYMVNAAWSKIHRTSFLKDKRIAFFDNKYGEDTIFSRMEIVSSDKWKIINYIGYNWFYNEASVSSTTQKGLRDTDKFISLLEKRFAIRDSDKRDTNYDLLKIAIFHLLFSGKDTDYTRFMLIYKQIISWIEKKEPSLYSINYLPWGPAGEKPKAILGINLFVLMHKLHIVGLFAKVYCRKREV